MYTSRVLPVQVKDGAPGRADKSFDFNLLQIQVKIFSLVISATGRNEALWMLPELSATAALEN